MRRGHLPVLLFLLAAGGVALLGSRVVASERASAERAARETLRARAQSAAAALEAHASRLLKEAATGDPDAVRDEEGRFLEPPGSAPLARLDPVRGADPEAEFYLAEGERAEAEDGDTARAAGLYGAAAAEGRDAVARAVARFRLAALCRRAGDRAAAEGEEASFLAVLPKDRRRTWEALVVRGRASPPDPEWVPDLLLHLGSGSDAVVRGLARDGGVPASAVEARYADLALLERLRSIDLAFLLGLTECVLVEDADPWRLLERDERRLVAWSRHGTVFRFREERLEGLLPASVRLLADGDGPGDPLLLEEVVVTGDPVRGQRILASAPRAGIEAEARRGAWLLGGALAALLLAGGAAFALSVRAARREAEAARARAAFVTKVGHDLRTPLAVVRMYAETLAAGKVADPAEAREFAGIAAREAERLTGMVGQVLDLERVSEGDGALARRPIDLAALVREVAAFHRPLLEHAGLRLEVRAEGPVPVAGDSAALRGAVSNMLENAARHAASGGSVAIEARRRGTMAEVRVLDRGPGLPPGMEETVFERFVRGPGAAGSGAGLGLALVREAAEAHGGAARAARREGGGAVFVVSLPLAGEEGA